MKTPYQYYRMIKAHKQLFLVYKWLRLRLIWGDSKKQVTSKYRTWSIIPVFYP